MLTLVSMSGSPVAGGQGGRRMLTFPPPQDVWGLYGLLADGSELQAGPIVDDPRQVGGNTVGLIVGQRTAEECQWWLIPRSDQLGWNQWTPPLSLQLLSGGSLLSFGGHCWFVTLRWQPEPQTVPAGLAEKKCPVCGGALSRAPVVRCLCGRWYHLEDPHRSEDPTQLNCYLRSGQCGSCGRPSSLQPQWVPPIPETLCGQGLAAELETALEATNPSDAAEPANVHAIL